MHGLIRHPDKRCAGIGIGIDRDRRNTHPSGGLDNPASNFAAIGNQDLREQAKPPSVFITSHAYDASRAGKQASGNAPLAGAASTLVQGLFEIGLNIIDMLDPH